MKRLTDLIISLIGLIILFPIFLPVIIIVYLQDFKSPFYVAERVGKNEKLFNMLKIRSMIVDADKSGVDSTSSDDMRITKIGIFIRKYKLDEFSQLLNVIVGSMSLVGPRPNVKREVDLYTKEEKNLLCVKPGITDFSSIVFSDEGEILKDKKDPDLAYNQLIRPYKSILGLFYIKNRTILLDFKLLYLTAISIISRDKALNSIVNILKSLNASKDIITVSKRKSDLFPIPPPGAKNIVRSRKK